MPGLRVKLPFPVYQKLMALSYRDGVHPNELVRRAVVLLDVIDAAVRRGESVRLVNDETGKETDIIIGWYESST